jgi:hypothetical protein
MDVSAGLLFSVSAAMGINAVMGVRLAAKLQTNARHAKRNADLEGFIGSFELLLVAGIVMIFGFFTYMTGALADIGSLLNVTRFLGAIYMLTTALVLKRGGDLVQ